MDLTGIFGDYTAFAPIIILLIGALILPAVQFVGKRRTATWAVALVFAIVSLIVNAIMLTDGYTGEALGLYEYDAYSGLMILLFLMTRIIRMRLSIPIWRILKSDW